MKSWGQARAPYSARTASLAASYLTHDLNISNIHLFLHYHL